MSYCMSFMHEFLHEFLHHEFLLHLLGRLDNIMQYTADKLQLYLEIIIYWCFMTSSVPATTYNAL